MNSFAWCYRFHLNEKSPKVVSFDFDALIVLIGLVIVACSMHCHAILAIITIWLEVGLLLTIAYFHNHDSWTGSYSRCSQKPYNIMRYYDFPILQFSILLSLSIWSKILILITLLVSLSEYFCNCSIFEPHVFTP